MIFGNTQRLKIVYNSAIQTPLCFKRSACEGVDTDVGIAFRICPRRWAFKTVRFVNHQTDVSVPREDLKSLS